MHNMYRKSTGIFICILFCIIMFSISKDNASYGSNAVTAGTNEYRNFLVDVPTQDTGYAPHNSVTDYVPDVAKQETINLYEKDNIPAVTEYYDTGSSTQDPENFIPNMTFVPVKEGIKLKGAVLICAGGAFQFCSDEAEGYSVADRLSGMG